MSAGIKQRLAAIIARVTPQLDWCQECGGFKEEYGGREAWLELVADSIVESLALKRETDAESWRWSTDWES